MWLPLLAAAFAGGADVPLPTAPPAGPAATGVTGNPHGNPAATPDGPAVIEHPATVTFDCKVPTEVLVDLAKVAQVWYPGQVSFKVAPGPHTLRVYVGGTPTDHPLLAAPDGRYTVLVGRTGTTLAADAAAAEVAGPAHLGVRVVGVPAAQIRIGDRREVVRQGTDLQLELTPGPHPFSLRSADGTAVWSTGTLDVGPGSSVVQVSEGRLPEVSGSATFRAGG